MRVQHFLGACMGAAAIAAAHIVQAKPAELVLPDFWLPESAPSLAAAANAADVAINGLQFDSAGGGLQPGDSVTLLAEMAEGAKRRQWMVLLVGSELSGKDRALPPLAEMRFFTSTGNELVYSGTRSALAIRVLGPVTVSADSRKPPKDVWSGALVNGQFLQMGFARGEAALQRLRETQPAEVGEGETPFYLSAATRPFPDDSIDGQRAAAAARGITRDDEMAIIGSGPALIEFFNVASRTPGVSDIMKSVVDLPVWSILSRLGSGPDLNIRNLGSSPIDPRSWELGESTALYERAFVLEINGNPAVCCRMVVTEPLPPLAASAGILAIAACPPDGKGPRVMIQVIASRLAPGRGG